MNSRGEGPGFPFPAAFFAALAGGLLGFYIYLALLPGPAGRGLYICAAASLSGALLGLLFWLRIYFRSGREISLSASLPYIAFLIPVFFFPDYFVGHGPPLGVSCAILAAALACFVALRFLLFARAASVFEEWVSRNSLKITVAAFLFFVVAVLGCGIMRYYNFAFPGADIGVFIQSFWTTLHGKLFWNTHELYPGASRFGKHFSAIMFLQLPFFALFPHGITLFTLGAVVLGAGGIAVYFLARDSLGRFAGLCFGLCFLLYPGILYPARSPYYFMHYAPLFLLLSLYHFRKMNLGLFCLFLVLACSARTEIALTAFFFGIYAVIQKRRTAWIVTPMVLSALWFGMAMGIIIPVFGPGTMWEFYEDTGGSPGGVLLSFLHNPADVLGRFISPDYLKLVYLMLLPLAVILPLLGTEIIFALPTLLIVGLSSRDQTRSIYGYYYMPLIPFLFASTITAVKRLSSGGMAATLAGRRGVHVLCTFLLFLSLAVFIRGPLAEMIAGGLTRPYNVTSGRGYNETLRKVVGLIPPEASVFTPRYLMPHLAKRMFVVPSVPYDAEYLIVDSRTADPWTVEIQKDAFIQSLDGNPGYLKLFDEKGVRLYRRRAP